MNSNVLKSALLFLIVSITICLRPSLQNYEFIELTANFGHLNSSTFSVDSDHIYVVGNEFCNATAYEGCFINGHVFKLNRIDYTVLDRDSLEGNALRTNSGLITTSNEGNTLYFLDGGYANYGCGFAGSASPLRTLSVIVGNENNVVANEESYPNTCVFRFHDGIITDGEVKLLGIERDPIFSSFTDSKILSFNSSGDLIASTTLDDSAYNNGQIHQTPDGTYHIFYRNNQSKLSHLKYDVNFNLVAGIVYEELPTINPLEIEFINDKFILLGEKNFDQDTSIVACFDLSGDLLWSQQLALEEARSIEIAGSNSLLIGSTDVSITKNVKISVLQLDDGTFINEYLLGNADDDEVFNEFLIKNSNLYIQGNLNCCDFEGYGEYGKIFIMVVPIDNLVNSDELIESPINVFPNPTSGELTVEYNGEYTVSIFDLYGSKVLHQKDNYSTSTIRLNHLPKGTYFIHIESSFGETFIVKKIVKI